MGHARRCAARVHVQGTEREHGPGTELDAPAPKPDFNRIRARVSRRDEVTLRLKHRGQGILENRPATAEFREEVLVAYGKSAREASANALRVRGEKIMRSKHLGWKRYAARSIVGAFSVVPLLSLASCSSSDNSKTSCAPGGKDG